MGHLVLADFRLLVLNPVAVEAVEMSVLVFLGEDSVKLGADNYNYRNSVNIMLADDSAHPEL